MKKYVLDFKRTTLPTYLNGDFTMTFDTLAEIYAFLKKARGSNSFFVLITKAEYENNSDVINATTTTISIKPQTLGVDYELTLRNSSNQILNEWRGNVVQIKNILKHIQPIQSGRDDSSIGIISIRKRTWNISSVGFVTNTSELVDIENL